MWVSPTYSDSRCLAFAPVGVVVDLCIACPISFTEPHNGSDDSPLSRGRSAAAQSGRVGTNRRFRACLALKMGNAHPKLGTRRWPHEVSEFVKKSPARPAASRTEWLPSLMLLPQPP